MEHTIYDWTNISEKFSEGLILGNGASVAIHPPFLYKSLYESACDNGFINASLKKVFQYYGDTRDFELILKMLWHTYNINQALEITDGHITTLAYKNLRNALIQSVQSVHVEYEAVCDTALPTIAAFLKRFKTVASLNYDLLVYWAMMHGNNQFVEGHWFKDGFINGSFDHDWRRFREPYKVDGSTLVFYPHGNLSLATGPYDTEHKNSCGKNNSSLLSTIIEKWNSAQYVPLFVSEGLTEQKKRAIQRSTYLQTVYEEVLPELGEHIAIYGWSISDNDIHILRAMKQAKKPIQSLAISIHTKTGRIQEKCNHIFELVRKIFCEERPYCKMPEIYFFDASSEDCWNNTRTEQNDILGFSRKILTEDW
jgi:hypothetical protein